MKKTLIAVLAVLALVLGALLVAPAVIDWSRYKAEIVARIEQATGRKVTVTGDVGLRLLPAPAFTARGITIGNPPGAGDQPFATADALSVHLRLLPLLRGEVAVNSLVLKRPEVHLARLPDGGNNWTFTPPAAPAPQASADRPAGPSASGGDANGFSIDTLRIEDGVVTWSGDAGRPLEARDIQATVEVRSTNGPFAARGRMVAAGTPLTFDGLLDRLAEDRGSAARLVVTLPAADASLRFNGMLSRLAEGPGIRGSLALTAADVTRLPGAAGLPVPGDRALTLEGTLAMSGQGLALSEVVATLAEAHATGGVTVDFGTPTNVDASLTVASLDLDRWLAAAPHGVAPQPNLNRASPPPATPADNTPSPTAAFTLPRDVFANLELAVNALSWRGAVIQQARANATLADGELVLNGLSAEGPGGSVASLAGVLSAADGRPGFDGQAELRADNLRATLGWLGVDTAAVAEGRLLRAEASAGLHAAWPEIELRNLSAKVDATSARGGATLRLTDRPAVGLALDVDGVNLDAYRAAPAQPPQPAAAPAESRPAPEPQPEAKAAAGSPLSGVDADVTLSVGRLTANGVTAQSIRLSALLDNGALTLRQASGDAAGSHLQAQGRITGLAQTSPRFDKVELAIDSPQPAALARFLGAHPPGFLAEAGRLTAHAVVDGPADDLAIDATADLGGVTAKATGTVAQALAAPSARLALEATAPSTVQAIRLFAPDYRPAGALGPFSLSATLASGPQSIDLTDLAVTLGPASLAGKARADLSGARPAVTATLTAGDLPLDQFLPADRTGMLLPGGRLGPVPLAPLPAAVVPAAAGPAATPWSRDPLDLSALRGFDARVAFTAQSVTWNSWTLASPQAQLLVENGAAALDSLTGQLLGGSLSAQARLSSSPQPTLSGKLSVADARLAKAKLGTGGISVSQGRMSAQADFTAAGHSTYYMAQSFGGSGQLSVADGVIEGFDLPAVSARLQNIQNLGSVLGLVQSGLQGGQTRFSKLSGTFNAENGTIISRDLKLDADGGTATGDLTLRLPPWTMQSAIGIQLAGSQAPAAVLRLEGPVGNPRKVVDVNALQQYLVSRGLGRALKGKDAGSLIEGLLGGGKSSAPAPQEGEQPQQQAPQKPEKVLRDALKGLLR